MLLDSFLEYRVGSFVGLKREGEPWGKEKQSGELDWRERSPVLPALDLYSSQLRPAAGASFGNEL